MNIFITGATGFIGSNLCRHLLKKGYNVHIGLRKKSDLSNIEDIKNDIQIYYYTNSIFDLASFFTKANIKGVFHLASCFIAEHKTDEVEKLIDSNVLFGTFLLEAMRVAGVKNLINTGTSWQHYDKEPYNPVCLYAATKEAFDAIIKYYTECEELSCITLKLFDSYSENDTRPKLINVLNQFAVEGKVLDMSEGEQEINLLHVNDICCGYENAYVLLLKNQNNSLNEQYALAAKEIVTLKKLIEFFNRIAPKKITVNWGLKPYRKREVMKLWSDFQTLPNWEQKISLEDGLNRLFKP